MIAEDFEDEPAAAPGPPPDPDPDRGRRKWWDKLQSFVNDHMHATGAVAAVDGFTSPPSLAADDAVEAARNAALVAAFRALQRMAEDVTPGFAPFTLDVTKAGRG